MPIMSLNENTYHKLEEYVSMLRKHSPDSALDPDAVSSFLRLNKADVLSLLFVGVARNLLYPTYKAYTYNGHHHLKDFRSLELVPDVIEDPASGNEIDRDEFYVNLVFEIGR